MIANCIYDSNVSFSTFLSLFSTRLWKPRQFPSLLLLLMLISKIRKTLGRLSPCMTKRSTFPPYFPRRSHHRATCSMLSLRSIFFPFLSHLRWHHRRRHSPLLFSFPFSSSTLLLFHSSITMLSQQTNRLVRSQNLHRFLPTTCILDLLAINFS